MNAVRLRGCRRCGGDLFLDHDEDGACLSCLQCGAVYSLPPPEALLAAREGAPGQTSPDSPALPSHSRSQRLISSSAGGAT
jgi:hypothetical protein